MENANTGKTRNEKATRDSNLNWVFLAWNYNTNRNNMQQKFLYKSLLNLAWLLK